MRPSYAHETQSPADARLDRFAKFNEAQNAGAQQDTSQQHALLQMLMQLYSMHNEQQKLPGQVEAQGLENATRSANLSHLPDQWSQEATKANDTHSYLGAEIPHMQAETEGLHNVALNFPTHAADEHAKAVSDLKTAESVREVDAARAERDLRDRPPNASLDLDRQVAAWTKMQQHLAYVKDLPPLQQELAINTMPDLYKQEWIKGKQKERAGIIQQVANEPDQNNPAVMALRQKHNITDDELKAHVPPNPYANDPDMNELFKMSKNADEVNRSAAVADQREQQRKAMLKKITHTSYNNPPKPYTFDDNIQFTY